MKHVKRILALLLALCLCLSFASAAEITETDHDHGAGAAELEVVEDTSPTEVPDKMTWELDASGTLWIGGTGIIIPIHSAEEQPWAKVRTQIETVRFRSSAHLLIEDIAYWFSGCTNLSYIELPAYVFTIGTDAFRDCNSLEELLLYHSEDAPAISESAFVCSGGTDLYVTVLSSKAEAVCNTASWSDRAVTVENLSGITLYQFFPFVSELFDLCNLVLRIFQFLPVVFHFRIFLP